MPEVTYTDVTWTTGDFITEAKLDNMTANDRAVDAMDQGVRMSERADPSTPPANTLHIYVKDKNGTSALYYIDDAGEIVQLVGYTPTLACPIAGSLFTGTSLSAAIIVTKTLTVTKAYAFAKVGPTGAALIMDIKKNGSSLWASTPANRITIADGAQYGTQTAFDVVSLVEGDILTPDIDQVGATQTGQDVTIELATK